MNTWNWKMTTEERELVEMHLGLVKKIIKTRFNRNYDTERADLIQIGNLGLIKAARFYTLRDLIDVSFATFAWPRITVHIRREINTRSVKKRLAFAVNNFMEKFYTLRGKHLTLRDVSIVFNIDEYTIKESLVKVENLDDVMEHEEFVDDSISPLEEVILKEETNLHEEKTNRQKMAKYKKLKKILLADEGRMWIFGC